MNQTDPSHDPVHVHRLDGSITKHHLQTFQSPCGKEIETWLISKTVILVPGREIEIKVSKKRLDGHRARL